MSTIVTLNRGAQSATPFGFNAGDASTERGSAFFTDFYTLDVFDVTSSFPLTNGACGLAKQTAGGASKLATKKIFVQAEGSAVSFAARIKATGSAATDSLSLGFTTATTTTIAATAQAFGFSISNAAEDDVSIAFGDTKTDSFVGITAGAQLPADFVATDFHVYGCELTRENGTNTCSWFVDGKKVHTIVSTPDASALFADLLLGVWGINGDVVTQVATIDWLSVSMPRV